MANAESFDEFYRRSRDSLVVTLAAVIGGVAEAQDAVQEAYLRAWTRWDRVSALDNPQAWVRRVAYNLAVSRWRRARRMVLHADVPDAEVQLSPAQEDLLDALRRLPADQRRAVVLHHLVGLPVVDVATEVGAPVGTVKSWLSRGRARLEIELARDGVQS